MFVRYGLEAGDLDGVSDDLLHWLGICDTTDLENDAQARHHCQGAIDCTFEFLTEPGAERHPRAEAIRQACLELSSGAFPVLSREQQDGVMLLSSAS